MRLPGETDHRVETWYGRLHRSRGRIDNRYKMAAFVIVRRGDSFPIGRKTEPIGRRRRELKLPNRLSAFQVPDRDSAANPAGGDLRERGMKGQRSLGHAVARVQHPLRRNEVPNLQVR